MIEANPSPPPPQEEGEEEVPLPLFKKIRKTITPALKKCIWELYVGIGKQKATCLLCGITEIKNNVNSGFEAAHLVARSFMATQDLNIYYAIPSCSICNNECENMCVLDFMYGRNRIRDLRMVIMKIYETFITEHGQELDDEQRMAWRVLEYLYGPTRFPAGGGIQNRKQIYELARLEQYSFLVQKSKRLTAELEQTVKEMHLLMTVEIKPMKIGF